MRTFVGLPAPDTWIARIDQAQSRIRAGRRVDEDDLHLTLAFLDDQPEDRLDALHEEMTALTLPQPMLTPVAWAVLGSGRPRAIVLDVVADAALTAIRDTVRRAARLAGIDLPRERFRPHITAVRFGRTAPADADSLPGTVARLGPPDLSPALAGPATLWYSRLTPAGPLYEALAQYPAVPA